MIPAATAPQVIRVCGSEMAAGRLVYVGMVWKGGTEKFNINGDVCPVHDTWWPGPDPSREAGKCLITYTAT